MGEAMRELVQQFGSLAMWSSALFFADKAAALEAEADDALYAVAECMARNGEPLRAAHTLARTGLHSRHLLAHLLAADALLSAGDAPAALRLLDASPDPSELRHDPLKTRLPRHRVVAALLVVRGRALAQLDRRAPAAAAFLRALHVDVHQVDALRHLARHRMLAPRQEADLLDALPFAAQCGSADEAELLRACYAQELDAFGSDDDGDESPLARLSSDAAESRARRLLYRGEFAACLRTLGPPDGDGERAGELRAACLAELKAAPALFTLAHRLVDRRPQSPVSWFAVGCYYYIAGKSEPARRYLAKATALDRGMGSAWLAYGHSFAADNEHDQAMAAYFKASQLMNGCHLPPLYIGLECGLTNNPDMADKFFRQALALAPDDPHVLHEMGVIAFQNRQYGEAESLWRNALSHVRAPNERWQPLLNNLGHACRKNGKYREAIAHHERALTLAPGCGATYCTLGLCFALLADNERAMDAFHAALSKRPDDSFAATMLKYLIDDLADRPTLADGAVPDMPFPDALDLCLPKPPDPPNCDATCTSDMSMSFDD